jgi:hypothetical protein
MIVKVVKVEKQYEVILPNNIRMKVADSQQLQRVMDLDKEVAVQLWDKIEQNLNIKPLK